MTESGKKPVVTDISLASEVARDVELVAVLLRNAHLECSIKESLANVKLGARQQFRSTYEQPDEGGRFRVVLAFVLDLHESDEEQQDVLHLTAEYQALYRVPEGKEYSEQSLQYFAQLNGPLNVWPYWRELVHSVVARVGLGSLTLPVFRVKPTAVPVEEKSEDGNGGGPGAA